MMDPNSSGHPQPTDNAALCSPSADITTSNTINTASLIPTADADNHHHPDRCLLRDLPTDILVRISKSLSQQEVIRCYTLLPITWIPVLQQHIQRNGGWLELNGLQIRTRDHLRHMALRLGQSVQHLIINYPSLETADQPELQRLVPPCRKPAHYRSAFHLNAAMTVTFLRPRTLRLINFATIIQNNWFRILGDMSSVRSLQFINSNRRQRLFPVSTRMLLAILWACNNLTELQVHMSDDRVQLELAQLLPQLPNCCLLLLDCSLVGSAFNPNRKIHADQLRNGGRRGMARRPGRNYHQTAWANVRRLRIRFSHYQQMVWSTQLPQLQHLEVLVRRGDLLSRLLQLLAKQNRLPELVLRFENGMPDYFWFPEQWPALRKVWIVQPHGARLLMDAWGPGAEGGGGGGANVVRIEKCASPPWLDEISPVHLLWGPEFQ